MNQKWLSWGDDYVVRDQAGRDAFFVDGKAWSWGSKLSFQNMQGRELAFISQKVFSWGPTFEIHCDGRLRGSSEKISLHAVSRGIHR